MKPFASRSSLSIRVAREADTPEKSENLVMVHGPRSDGGECVSSDVPRIVTGAPIATINPGLIMKSTRTCAACGTVFTALPHIPNQRYCSAAACQRARRRAWQRERLHTDSDYRDNQARARAGWLSRHPDYWRQYRATHPAYTERNRVMQRARNTGGTCQPVAKMDALQPVRPLASGFYILRDAVEAGIAKMNAWTVHIAILSAPAVASP